MFKKLFIILSMLLVFVSFANAGLLYQSYIDNLLEAWNFNNGTSAYYHGFNFISTGATWINTTFNNFGRAYYFDGSGDNMSAPYININGTGNYAETYNFWIMNLTNAANGEIISQQLNAINWRDINFYLAQATYPTLTLYVGEADDSFTNIANISCKNPLSTKNTWTMISINFPDSTHVKVYCDGINTQNATFSTRAHKNSAIVLGGRTGVFANVIVDELMFFNRSLTDSEIVLLNNTIINVTNLFQEFTPTITPVSPADNAHISVLNFTFYANFNQTLYLYLNGTLNQSLIYNTSPAVANFSIYSIPEGNYSWFIRDNYGNYSANRTFIYDVTKPAISNTNNLNGTIRSEVNTSLIVQYGPDYLYASLVNCSCSNGTIFFSNLSNYSGAMQTVTHYYGINNSKCGNGVYISCYITAADTHTAKQWNAKTSEVKNQEIIINDKLKIYPENKNEFISMGIIDKYDRVRFNFETIDDKKEYRDFIIEGGFIQIKEGAWKNYGHLIHFEGFGSGNNNWLDFVTDNKDNVLITNLGNGKFKARVYTKDTNIYFNSLGGLLESTLNITYYFDSRNVTMTDIYTDPLAEGDLINMYLNVTYNDVRFTSNWTWNSSLYPTAILQWNGTNYTATGTFGSIVGQAAYTHRAENNYIYFNYTVDTATYDYFLWQVKHGTLDTYNISIPSYCQKDYMELRIYSSGGIVSTTQPQCLGFDNSTWYNIGKPSTGSAIGGCAAVVDGYANAVDNDYTTGSAYETLCVTPTGWVNSGLAGDTGAYIYEQDLFYGLSTIVFNVSNLQVPTFSNINGSLISHRWNLLIYNYTPTQELYTTPFTNQVIYGYFMDNCTSGIYQSYNFTTFDIDLKTKVITNFKFNADYIINTGIYKNVSYSLSGRSEYLFCVNPAAANFLTNFTIQVSATGYKTNDWVEYGYYATGIELKNISIYLLNSSSTTEITVHVINEDDEDLMNRIVELWYDQFENGTYVLISSDNTNNLGQVKFDVNLDNRYFFKVKEDTEVLLVSTIGKITDTTIELLIIGVDSSRFTTWKNIKGLDYTLTYVNTTKRLSFYYNDVNNVSDKYIFSVYYDNGTLFYQENTTNKSATLYADLNVDNTSYYAYASTVDFNDNTFLLDDMTINRDYFWTLLGSEGIIYTMIFYISTTLLGLEYPIISALLGFAGILFIFSLGFTAMTLPIVMWIASLTIIIIILIRKVS